MKTKEVIQKEINDMKRDLEIMKTRPARSEEMRKRAMGTQKFVIEALEWVLED